MEQYELETPEAVPIAYAVAGIGSRFLAASVDGMVWFLAFIVLVFGSIGIGLLGGVGQTIASIVFLTLFFVLLWGYYIIFETVWSGQTPGKRLVGIRVIKTSGYPIGFVEAAIRNLVRLADFLPLMYGVGVIVMFISTESRRLGDYAAGTLVVKERSPVKLRELERSGDFATTVGLIPPIGSVDPEELSWNLRELTSNDLQVIGAYLERAPSLSTETRGRVGREIMERIAPRIGATEPLDPVQFLQRIVSLHNYET